MCKMWWKCIKCDKTQLYIYSIHTLYWVLNSTINEMKIWINKIAISFYFNLNTQ